MPEFTQKQDRIKSLLAERQLDALLLQRVSSFAWATCGAASYINSATTDGTASLLVTPSGRYLVTTNIEATRLEQEEKLVEQGWEMRAAPWYAANDAVAQLTRGLKLGADGPYPGATDLSNEVTQLRMNLMPEEGERFRALGRLCAEAMDSAVRAVRPGQTEYQIAGLLAHEAQSRGAQAYRQPHRHRRAHFQIPPSAAHRQKARTLRHARVVRAQVGPGVLHHAVRSLWPAVG